MFAVLKTSKFRCNQASRLSFLNRTASSLLVLVIVLTSCRSISYETPNALRNIPATLHLANGRSYHGNLIVHTNRHSNSAVKLYTVNAGHPFGCTVNAYPIEAVVGFNAIQKQMANEF